MLPLLLKGAPAQSEEPKEELIAQKILVAVTLPAVAKPATLLLLLLLLLGVAKEGVCLAPSRLAAAARSGAVIVARWGWGRGLIRTLVDWGAADGAGDLLLLHPPACTQKPVQESIGSTQPT